MILHLSPTFSALVKRVIVPLKDKRLTISNIRILHQSNNRGHDLSRECKTVTARGIFNQDDYYNQLTT